MTHSGTDFSGPGSLSDRFLSFFSDEVVTWKPTHTKKPVWCLGSRYPPASSSAPSASSSLSRQLPSTQSQLSKPQAWDASIDTPTDQNQASLLAESLIEDPTSEEPEVVDKDAIDPWGDLLDHVESKFQFTYRYNFPLIPRSTNQTAPSALKFVTRATSYINSGFTSDRGWGCMIRSGQSLLANALMTLHHGRDWRRRPDTSAEVAIVSLFADDPSAPFSIHKFVEYGDVGCKICPGGWFGPTPTAMSIKHLATPDLIRVYVPESSIPKVYVDEFMDTAVDADGNFHPTLILIPARLGPDRIFPCYQKGVMSLFEMPQLVGIAGGRPGASHYFIAAQKEDQLLFLDPHNQQPAIPRLDQMTTEDTEIYVRSIQQPSFFKATASNIIASTMATISALQSNLSRSRSSSRPPSSSGTPPTLDSPSDSSAEPKPDPPRLSDRPRSRSQPAFSTIQPPCLPPTELLLRSCHRRVPFTMSISDIDSSMLLAFLIRNEDDWLSWKKHIDEHPLYGSSSNPLIEILETKPSVCTVDLDDIIALDDDEEDDEGEVVEHSDTEEGDVGFELGEVLLCREGDQFYAHLADSSNGTTSTDPVTPSQPDDGVRLIDSETLDSSTFESIRQS